MSNELWSSGDSGDKLQALVILFSAGVQTPEHSTHITSW